MIRKEGEDDDVGDGPQIIAMREADTNDFFDFIDNNARKRQQKKDKLNQQKQKPKKKVVIQEPDFFSDSDDHEIPKFDQVLPKIELQAPVVINQEKAEDKRESEMLDDTAMTK